jgi:hypothetical protein
VQDGRSLLGLVRDPGVEWGRELLVEGGNAQGLTFTALRNYRWKYVEHATGEAELYDLQRDPDELVSRHADPALAGLRGTLAARLARLRACAGRSCRARPRLKLAVERRRCAFVTAVRGADAGHVDLVRFLVRRRPRSDAAARVASFRRLAAVRRAPLRRVLRPVGVLPGRRALLRARIALDDGRAVTLDRRVRACG